MVLVVGFYLRDVGDVVGIDVARMVGAKQYKVLWRVIARRVREVQNKERRRLRRVVYVRGRVGIRAGGLAG